MVLRRAWQHALLACLWLGLLSPLLANPIVPDPTEGRVPAAAALPLGIQVELTPSAEVFAAAILVPREVRPAAWPSVEPTAAAMAQPFGHAGSTVLAGGLQQKWRKVKARLPGERKTLARCRADPDVCDPSARLFLSLIANAMQREGKMRIAEINRAINLTIRFSDDQTLYGVEELWATPLMTFAHRAGDCEDYAIAKYVALQEMGFTTRDLRLVIVRDEKGEGHAMAAVRHDGRWLVLDNRHLDLKEDVQTAESTPLFVIDDEGAKRLVASTATPRTAAPPPALSLLAIPQWPLAPAVL